MAKRAQYEQSHTHIFSVLHTHTHTVARRWRGEGEVKEEQNGATRIKRKRADKRVAMG